MKKINYSDSVKTLEYQKLDAWQRTDSVDCQVSFRLLISCSTAQKCSVKVQSRSQKAFFVHSPCG